MLFRLIANQIIEAFVRLILGPILSINPKVQEKFIERLLFHLNKYAKIKNYLFLVVRPKSIFDSGFQAISLSTHISSTTIVMQGPILSSDNFTLESIYLYRAMFPRTQIILATWSDEASDKLAQAKNAGVNVVLCKRPETSGFLNFNLQRASTIEGLKEAKRLGAQLVIKTRTDQRINSRYAISLLISLVKKFPSSPSIQCKHRVFFLSLSSLANVPFHLSDMLQFGHIDDLLKVWDAPVHGVNIARKDFEKNIENKATVADVIFRTPTNPEVWIGKHYAENLYGPQCMENPSGSFIRLLKEAVGIVDRSQLDLSWPKYSAYEECSDYRLPKTFEQLSFSKWLSLESGVSDDIVNYDANSKM
jgi:hypothetical protein